MAQNYHSNMKKFILNLIFILLVSIGAYSQTGLGYVDYRVIRTQNGNGTSWTYNGVTYGGQVDNQAEFDGMFDLTNPANRIMAPAIIKQNGKRINPKFGSLGNKRVAM